MKTKLSFPRPAAALLALAALLVCLAALSPAGSLARGSATSCGNKIVSFGPPPKSKIPVKAIETEGGTSCAAAVKVIAGGLQGKLPSGWKSVETKVEAPAGLFEQEYKNGSKAVRFAIRGG